MEILKLLRVLGDKNRVRILRLLQQEELSVAELQEILGMGQSRISMQLSQLKQASCVEVRRTGQKSLYRIALPSGAPEIVLQVLAESADEIAETAHDAAGLQLVLNKRRDNLRAHFDNLAGKFGRDYVPGRSWKALTEMLLRLMPPLIIADLGAGEGTLSLLLAQRALQVLAVDNSPKMVEYGSELARRNGVENLKYLQGDLEALPIENSAVDLVLMHQTLHHALHPARAIEEAFRILKVGGQIVILDLLQHEHEAERELYGDVWPGFSQVQLNSWLHESGFENIDVAIVHRESEAPQLQIVLAMARKIGI